MSPSVVSATPVRVRRVGWTALLCEVASQDAAHRFAALINHRRGAGPFAAVRDVVPGAETVLVTVAEDDLAAVRTQLEQLLLPPGPLPSADGALLEIPVRYDGPDLPAVAARAGLDVAAVIGLHTRAVHTVAFAGFSAGWSYIGGLPVALHLPRLASPRTRVPPGSVAIAGPYTGIYPRASPGGWNLIGTSAASVWDTAADPPSPLWPGRRIRFVAIS